MSFLAFLNNRTPFSAARFVLPDPRGQEAVLIVVVATFVADDSSGQLRLADEQKAVQDADEYHGPPESSSVRYEADLALQKPFVDVLLNGTAYAPRGKAASSVHVHLQVGDVVKDLIVSGDRRWRGSLPSTPAAFVTMPLVYERAFGGIDRRSPDPAQHAGEPRNLVGVGFQGVPSPDPRIETDVPNVEYPNARMSSTSDRPQPGGLGSVGRGWTPRLSFAGTFDDQWLDQQWPFLPVDFDPRHNQSAPADQQSPALRGGEAVSIDNLTPDGRWQFRLPRLDVPVTLLYDRHQSSLELALDTILIEPDLRRVVMTSRTAIQTVRGKGALREIVLGHMSTAWLRARSSRKRYQDRGRMGVLTHRPTYTL